jgi:hypothetical protein
MRARPILEHPLEMQPETIMLMTQNLLFITKIQKKIH